MIKTKLELIACIEKDNSNLFLENREKHIKYMKKVRDPRYYIYVYLKCLRKEEFYRNQDRISFATKAIALFYERKRNKLGRQLGFCMEPNCFDEGLNIYHCGCVVVNPAAKVGKNCHLHGNNCIGNNGKTNKCPIIGDNVDVGFGAIIIGDVQIADNITIGANAVVNKSFLDPGITIAGVPAQRVK